MRIALAGWLVFLSVAATAAPYAVNTPEMSNPSATATPFMSRQESPLLQDVETQGSIVSVDTVFGQLTLQDELGNAQDFRVNSNVPVLQQGVQLKLADLKPGDRVLLRYTSRPLLVQRIQKL